jgi:hypothetical protein
MDPGCTLNRELSTDVALQVSGPWSQVSGGNGATAVSPETRDLGPETWSVPLYGFTDSGAEGRPSHRLKKLNSASDISRALSALYAAP